jgi:hypothetical protein
MSEREYTQETFYAKTYWANSYYAALLPLEYFLSQVLLRGDMTRVLWSSEDIAFRKRFQSVGIENGGDFETIQPQTLNFPFVSYWYTGGLWTPDDRPFSVQPMQMIRGTWTEGLPANLRAMAVKTSFDATAYFDRDDEARMGYEAMLWEQQPKGPVQFATTLGWRGVDLVVPVNITIESIEFNPEYKEGDWLKKQRMVPIKMKFVVRTYILFFPHQLNSDGTRRLATPFSTGAVTVDPEEDKVYITEEVILNFAAAKQWGTLDEFTGTAIITDPDSLTLTELTNKVADVRALTSDIVTGYFQPATDITVNACIVDPNSITPTSFNLMWAVRPADMPNLDFIRILVPGQPPTIVQATDPAQTAITGLYPLSTYEVTLLFYSISGAITEFKLTVTTAADSTDTNPLPAKRRRGRLKGTEW